MVNIKKAGKWMVPVMVLHRPCQMAMRKDEFPVCLDSFLLKAIEIVDLPIKSHKKIVIFHRFLLVYQRVGGAMFGFPHGIMTGWWFEPIPLKNDGVSSSVGMMTFPTEWKVIIHSCSSHHQSDVH